MKYFITGADGFIGRWTTRKLRAAGHEVVATDNNWRYPNIHAPSNFLDVRNVEAVKILLDYTKPDVVLHMAAINGTKNFYDIPEVVLEVGLKGALNIVEGCEYAGIKHLVMFSSSEVYQTIKEEKADESVPFSIPEPSNPRYSYAISKMASEVLAIHSGVNRVSIVRPHNVYGPESGDKHVIPQFIERAKRHREGTPFLVQGDADQTRAFCYIDDFIDGLLRVIEHGVDREIYHIGTEDERTIASVAIDVCRGVRGYTPTLEFGGGAAGGPARRCPDTRKLQSLGWSQQVEWSTGLLNTIKAYS